MSTDEVRQAAPRAKVLNRERVRFEVAGGNHRLVVAFDFRRQIAFVKFIGTHAEYDRVDVLTASQFSRETRIDIRPIRTDEDHRAALEEIEACWGAAEGTEEGDKLEVLAALVELYEAKRWPVDTAESFDPIDVLRHAIEGLGHTQADQSQHRSVPQSASTRDDRGAPAASRGVSSGSRGGQRTLDHKRSLSPCSRRLSSTLLVNSSMNSGTPSVRSAIWSMTSSGNALRPAICATKEARRVGQGD
jgi:antitoxin component HigA of HigAB toxin-antitoxin module